MAKSKPVRKKKDGPYLAAALFCETVIEDAADRALSAIRIIDTITLVLPDTPDFPSKENRLPVRMTGLLSFKTGGSPGEHVVRVVMISPSGKKNPALEQTITLREPEQGGANVTLRTTIGVVKGGLFWFHVYLDGKLLTRMPLKIVLEKSGQSPAETSGARRRP